MTKAKLKGVRIILNAYKQGIPVPTIAIIAAISEEEVVRILGGQGIV